MLKEHGVEHEYREYTATPLSREELAELFQKLDVPVVSMLRKRDVKKLELQLDLADEAALLDAMAEHPTLLQRPIGVLGERAVNGRPVENLLSLLES